MFIGYNPSPRSAEMGHHYAGRSNRFWTILHKAGLTREILNFSRDLELLGYGYGSVNIVDRPTKAADEITREEYTEGRKALKGTLETYRPQAACYVGIGVYKAFTGKSRVCWGLQEEQSVPGVVDFVAPSTSGLNRMPMERQIEIYRMLKQLVDAMERQREG